MSVLSTILIFSLIGVLRARQPDIDINRVKLLPSETSNSVYTPSNQGRRFLEINQFNRNNDYDDHSIGVSQPRAPMHLVHDTSTSSDTEIPIKVHQPREDPRLFYQSDAYLKANNRRNVNYEVSSIYPGRNVIRASEEHGRRSLPIQLKNSEQNHVSDEGFNLCVRCPHDRTLIAKAGSERVMLQSPRLLTCSGRKAPRNVHFDHMYGAKFDSLLEQGSHMVVGRIMYKSKTLQLCKMQVHVLVQGCPIPKYLKPNCGGRNEPCNFTCKDTKAELHGESSLLCGEDLKWKGELPVCRVRTWCDPPPPPEHGRVSCQGAAVADGSGLIEGSRCRARCARGWRWSPRAAAVCRRGAWTHGFTCQPKRNNTLPKR